MAEIRIEELQPKYTLDDKTVILVEDDDDTKKSTVGSLMSSITYNESINPNKQANKFYNATQIQRLLKMYSEGTNDPETIAQLYQQIQELDANVNELKDAITEQANKLDHCGLIEDYGDYYFCNERFSNCGVVEANPFSRSYIGYESMMRNNKLSVKVSPAKADIKCDFYMNVDEREVSGSTLVSLLFYINANIIDKLSSYDGITIKLAANTSIQPENYYYFNIPYNDMVNGWNCPKYRVNNFSVQGNAPARISRVFISVPSDVLVGDEMYFNSVIFDQRMKPTVLLNFDGYYKDTSFSYTYPLLINKNIKATVFSNGSSTLSNDNINEALKYKYNSGWYYGMNETTNNRDILLEDNSYRNQYTILKNTLENWVKPNFTYNPIAYSTSKNIRNITIPILKDLGYKIARDRKTKNSYCSFFSDKDFCIPSVFFFNDTETSGDDPVDSDAIKAKIDYIIETGQCMSLYTNNITTYGSNVDASKSQFEAIIDYISKKVQSGELQCLTFEEFYNRCIN